MPKKGRTWRAELEVIGLRFRWKKDGRAALASMAAKSDITGIRLVREPDNKWDENAIMVMLPERLMGGRQLGYLHRQAAELLAPKLDSGSLEVVSAKLMSLDPGVDYNTGSMDIIFRDVATPAKRGKRPATKGKARTS
jgi:hypothetical protein